MKTKQHVQKLATCMLLKQRLARENMSMPFCATCVVLLLLLIWGSESAATPSVPLSTEGRWIVDERGQRVKLGCVNWVGHLDAAVPEGMSKQPVEGIAKRIAALGFNCVRLTWPIYLVMNLQSVTVRNSLQSLGLLEALSGIQTNNPSIIDLPLINAFQAVVSSLGKNNVMVILDNHVSRPGWCCGKSDGNGFFGDEYFDPDMWLQGLTKMATIFNKNPNVIAMSLRNELRGSGENVDDWYKYMQKGAEAVHTANPNLLVILSGLNFDLDLSFLRNKPVSLSFTRKLVYEAHWYSFSSANHVWETGNPNQVCGNVANERRNALWGFLLQQGYPILLSEFGVDQKVPKLHEDRFLSCLLGLVAELDVDWALWALGGSYYIKNGQIGAEEEYGLLTQNWQDITNANILQRLSAIQLPFQGPGLPERKPHKLIFHPATGLCVVVRKPEPKEVEALQLGPCTESQGWSYTREETLKLDGTGFCIQAADVPGQPAKLGTMCTSKWEMVSDSKLHLASKLGGGASVCLDTASDNAVLIINTCKCLSQDNTCDPSSQWFKLIDSTRRSKSPLANKIPSAN